MGKFEKLYQQILSGHSDSNIRFDDLRSFLISLGFDENIKGSHHMYQKDGIIEQPNIQRDGNKAKSYQVKQIRKILIKYNL